MKSKPLVRESTVIEVPEQYVTVQIHNTSFKKKFRNHRQSIINEMKHTQDLLEETLNRNLQYKSKFSPTLTAQLSPNHTSFATPNRPLRKDLSSSRSQPFKAGGEMARKLKQLCNISQHFDTACDYRQSVVPTQLDTMELSYSLPVVSPTATPSAVDRRAKEEILEHRTMVRDWQVKAKLGRDYVKRAKLKQPMRYRNINQINQHESERENQRDIRGKPSLRSLRDIYFSELRQERKTVQPQANNLELIFLQQRQKRGGIGYVGAIEQQPALPLQRFIEGGQERGFGQYSDWLNLSEFRRSKQKYKILDKLYNHVKENNLYEFKDMNADKLNDQSLLSVVYYLQNSSNMTEGERRNLRKKLRVLQ